MLLYQPYFKLIMLFTNNIYQPYQLKGSCGFSVVVINYTNKTRLSIKRQLTNQFTVHHDN